MPGDYSAYQYLLCEQPEPGPWRTVLGMIADVLTVRREVAPLIDGHPVGEAWQTLGGQRRHVGKRPPPRELAGPRHVPCENDGVLRIGIGNVQRAAVRRKGDAVREAEPGRV